MDQVVFFVKGVASLRIMKLEIDLAPQSDSPLLVQNTDDNSKEYKLKGA